MGINLIKKYLAGMGNCLSLPPDLKITVAAITAEAVERSEKLFADGGKTTTGSDEAAAKSQPGVGEKRRKRYG
jgi:hypothetical protein